MRFVLPALLLAATALLSPAHAQIVPGDPAAGLEIARTWCANCHVVDTKPTRAGDAVPSFPTIAAMKSTTALSLQAFLTTPHGGMPNFQLSRGQVDDAVAYILTLKK